MSDLKNKKCVPCLSYTTPLRDEMIIPLCAKLNLNWKVVERHHLEREYAFKNFKEALTFTNIIGKISEEENHHPDIFLSWGQVKLSIWTHKINGLSENDFILAAKIEAEYISHYG